MATTYYEAKAVLDEVSARMTADAKRADQAKALIVAADNDLAAMATDYSGFASDLDTLASNNPNNDAIQVAKAEKDQLLTERATLKSMLAALRTAVGE